MNYDYMSELLLPATIGERIRQMRNYRCMYQNELAEKCGCSHSYISQVESGQRTPTLHTLTVIANALDCELDIIFKPKGS